MRVLVDVLIKLHAHNCVCQIKDLESSGHLLCMCEI